MIDREKDMQSSVSVKKIVTIDLFLHTVIIVMITFIAIKSPSNLFFLGMLILAGISLAIYTTHRIIRCINEGVSRREKELAKLSDDLLAWAENLGQCGRKLKQHAEMMGEREKALLQRVGCISNYGNKMRELVASIDAQGVKSVETLTLPRNPRVDNNHEP